MWAPGREGFRLWLFCSVSGPGVGQAEHHGREDLAEPSCVLLDCQEAGGPEGERARESQRVSLSRNKTHPPHACPGDYPFLPGPSPHVPPRTHRASRGTVLLACTQIQTSRQGPLPYIAVMGILDGLVNSGCRKH